MVRHGTGPLLLVAVAVVLAGCGGVLAELAVEHHVTVSNEADSTQEVHLAVEKDGETVLEETTRIDAGGTWHVTTVDEPGDYEVVVETAEGEHLNESYSLPQAPRGRASFLDVRIEEDGSLSSSLVRED